MSLNNNVPISQHTGNGVTTSFLYDFKIFLAADLVVEVDGVVKTLNVDYSITGIGNDTGDVIFTVAPPAATAILLYRAVAFSRSIEYQYQGALPAVVVNRDIERLWMAAQELQTKIVRSFQLPLSVSGIDVTLPTPVAGRAVKWNATGTALIYSDQDPDEIAAAAAASAAAAAASQSASAANAAQTNLDRLAADAAASAAAASAASINPSNLMHLTGVETAAGIKTFSDSPVVPNLTVGDTTAKAANAKLVADSIAANNLSHLVIQKRQSIQFGPTTGATSVSDLIPQSQIGATLATGVTLKCSTKATLFSVANGFDATGAPVDLNLLRSTDLSVPGLAASTTNYIWVDVVANTAGAVAVADSDQKGGTIPVTNNQHTFDTENYKNYVGNGAAAVQSNRLIVAEVDTNGTVVTAIRCRAYRGFYRAPLGVPFPAALAEAAFLHNVGSTGCKVRSLFECTVAELGFSVGQELDSNCFTNNVSQPGYTVDTTKNGIAYSTGVTPYTLHKTTKAVTAITVARWNWRPIVERSW